jgi:hypothetical protein
MHHGAFHETCLQGTKDCTHAVPQCNLSVKPSALGHLQSASCPGHLTPSSQWIEGWASKPVHMFWWSKKFLTPALNQPRVLKSHSQSPILATYMQLIDILKLSPNSLITQHVSHIQVIYILLHPPACNNSFNPATVSEINKAELHFKWNIITCIYA